VRELANTVEREILHSCDHSFLFADFGRDSEQWLAGRADQDVTETKLQPLNVVIARHIRRALKVAGGKVGGVGGAAELLAINPSTLRKRMRKLGILFGKQARL